MLRVNQAWLSVGLTKKEAEGVSMAAKESEQKGGSMVDIKKGRETRSLRIC